MAYDAGTARIRIGVDTKEFENSMNNLQSSMKRVGDRMASTGKTMTKYVTGPIVGAGAAIGGLVSKTASYGDELDKTSTKLGVGVEQLQDWRHWAEQNGISADALERGMGRLNQRIGRAIQGNEKYSEAFENLGISLKDSRGNVRETDEVMRETVETLMAIEDPAVRSAEASELFGTKMARDLMPALEDGSLSIEEAIEQMDEHGRITTEQAEKSAEFQDAMDNLKKSFMGIVHEIGMDFLPLLQDELLPLIEDKIIPAFRTMADQIKSLIEWFTSLDPRLQKIILAGIGLAAALGPVLIVAGKLISAFSAMVPLFKAVGTVMLALASPIGIKIAAIVALIAIGVALYRNWEEIKQYAAQLWGAVKETFEGIRDSIVGAVTGAIDKVREVFTGILDFVKGLASDFLEAGKNLIGSFVDGIKRMASKPVDAVKDMAGRVRDFLPFSPAKDGPLRDLNKLDFGGPIADSIKGDMDDVQGSMSDMLTMPDGRATGAMNGGTADITVELDGRTIAKAVGQPLVDQIRVKTGMRL